MLNCPFFHRGSYLQDLNKMKIKNKNLVKKLSSPLSLKVIALLFKSLMQNHFSSRKLLFLITYQKSAEVCYYCALIRHPDRVLGYLPSGCYVLVKIILSFAICCWCYKKSLGSGKRSYSCFHSSDPPFAQSPESLFRPLISLKEFQATRQLAAKSK